MVNSDNLDRARHTNQTRSDPEPTPAPAPQPDPVDPAPTDSIPVVPEAPSPSLLVETAPTPEWTQTGHLAFWCDSCLDEGHTIGYSRSATFLDRARIVHDRIQLKKPERRARTDADAVA